MTSVAVIDYGMGNLRSVSKALEHVAPDAEVMVTSDSAKILAADRIVFPGQGAMGHAMAELQRYGLEELIQKVIVEKPFLGICLGLQALLENSDEDGGTAGLGVFPGNVKRFAEALHDPDTGLRLKVPHMGWNQVHQENEHPLWNGIEQDSRFYFVHSYYVQPTSKEVTAATTRYGVEFVSAASHDNVFAVQFHPEKRQHDGLKLLENFMQWDGQS